MPKEKSSKPAAEHAYAKLQAFDEQVGALRVVIEAPRGCQNKYKLNEHTGLFDLHKVLPSGMSFPLDFGYVPATLADDGDPIDVLMFSENPTFTGCVARVRLIGVIKAEQRGAAEPDWKKNHRLLAVALVSHTHQNIQTIDDLDPEVLDELEQFFVVYNKAQGKQFNLLGRGGKETAEQMVREAMARRIAVEAHFATSDSKKSATVTKIVARTNVIPISLRAGRNSFAGNSETDFHANGDVEFDDDDTESGDDSAAAKAKKAAGLKRAKAKKAAAAKRLKAKKTAGSSKSTKAKKVAGVRKGTKKATGVRKGAKKATSVRKGTKKATSVRKGAKKATAVRKGTKKATGSGKSAKKATAVRKSAKKAIGAGKGAKKTSGAAKAKTKKAVGAKPTKAKVRKLTATAKKSKTRKISSAAKKPKSRKTSSSAKQTKAKKPTAKRVGVKKTAAKKRVVRKPSTAKKTKAKAKPRAKKTALKPKKGVKISKLVKATRAKQKKSP